MNLYSPNIRGIPYTKENAEEVMNRSFDNIRINGSRIQFD